MGSVIILNLKNNAPTFVVLNLDENIHDCMKTITSKCTRISLFLFKRERIIPLCSSGIANIITGYTINFRC